MNNAPSNSQAGRKGFTLLELLVVTAIIVVLISILMPALEKAIYAAELTSCATRQRAAAQGVTMYAQDFQRNYPYRSAVYATNFWPMAIAYGQAQHDARPLIRKYMSLNATLNCPLGLKLDVDGSTAATAVFGAENMWFGWQYTRPNTGTAPNLGQKESGMQRQGDKWEWLDESNGYRLKSRVIMGTRYIWNSAASMSSSHPASTYASVPINDANYTYYRWDSGAPDRGLMDLNFTFSDLSGERYSQVDWNYDERMARSPSLSLSSGWPSNWEWTPKGN